MKKLCLRVIVSFGLVTVHDLKSVYAFGGGGVPLSQLAGGYASTVIAALAICLDPASLVEESCTTVGALVVTVTNLSAGELTLDQKGNLYRRTPGRARDVFRPRGTVDRFQFGVAVSRRLSQMRPAPRATSDATKLRPSCQR